MSEPSNMPETGFSPAVKEAIRRNRKIDAIKILREEQKIGLKEAKDIIDAHFAEYRKLHAPQRGAGESGSGRNLLLLVAFLAAAYVVYRLLVQAP
jgi:hypothetical protein